MGQSIGKFQVVEKIGEGGFGVIFKGRDPHIKRHVAIKSCTSEDPDIRTRFAHEAQIAGNLHHRHIVTVYDFGEEDGVPYLVQEYLSGEDLDRKVKRADYIPFPEKLLYLVQIARGLEYAHRQGVVHRDIKPANIRILDDGTAKIMDFGIAKLANRDTGLTQTGMTLGTAAYLAPEQIRGESVDPRTDIFSYGVMAYELLTYRRPFVGQHMSTVLYQILNEEPVPPSRHTPGLPKSLDDLVLRCLSKDAEQRYPSMDSLLQDLKDLLEERRRGGAGSRFDSEADAEEQRTRRLPADPQVDAEGEYPGPDPSMHPTSPPPSRSASLDDLELDATFDGTRTPHSISSTQVFRSRGFAWGPWAAAVVVLVALGLAGWVYNRQQTRMGTSSGLVEDGSTVEEEGEESPGSAFSDSEEPSGTDAETAAENPAGDEMEVTSEDLGTAPADGETPPEDEPAEGTAEPEPEPPPAPPEGTLILPAAWDPDIEVVVGGSSSPLRLDREHRLTLEPGTYPLEFSFYEGGYSDARTIEVTVGEDEEVRVPIPIRRPALLRVQPALSSPSDAGFVKLGSRMLGPTGLNREYRVPPGRYTLQIFRDTGDDHPSLVQELELHPRERVVANFSYRRDDVIINRSRIQNQ